MKGSGDIKFRIKKQQLAFKKIRNERVNNLSKELTNIT